jgi:hypothetical protein
MHQPASVETVYVVRKGVPINERRPLVLPPLEEGVYWAKENILDAWLVQVIYLNPLSYRLGENGMARGSEIWREKSLPRRSEYERSAIDLYWYSHTNQ